MKPDKDWSIWLGWRSLLVGLGCIIAATVIVTLLVVSQLHP